MQGEQPLDRSAGGLGLGLTLVRHLVELHGGEVEARSAGAGRTYEPRYPSIRRTSTSPALRSARKRCAATTRCRARR